jgi:hypothetical protein
VAIGLHRSRGDLQQRLTLFDHHFAVLVPFGVRLGRSAEALRAGKSPCHLAFFHSGGIAGCVIRLVFATLSARVYRNTTG